MADGSREELLALLAHSGFTPSEADIDDMVRVYEVNQARLRALHDADLDDEEVAGAFTSMWKEG